MVQYVSLKMSSQMSPLYKFGCGHPIKHDAEKCDLPPHWAVLTLGVGGNWIAKGKSCTSIIT
jgi:hypothetical protein